jgi:nicotinamide-nucleotide amidase
MKIAIVSIGNEILNGSIVDTNSNYIAKTLQLIGYSINTIISISDDIKQIENVFKTLSKTYDLVLTTGGLGPTFDDRTTEALAKSAKEDVYLNKEIYKDVLKKVKSKGVRLKLSHLRQAYLPRSSQTIKNDHGTACGIMMKINKANFISMPGVPSEMKPMFENYVIEKIKELFPTKVKLRYDLKLVGVAESDMDDFLSTVNTDNLDIILNAQEGELAVRIFSYKQNRLDDTYDKIFKKFSYKLYSKNDELIEDVVGDLLKKASLKVGVVESFTGGYLTTLLSNKESFTSSLINKQESLDNLKKIKGADIIVFPSSLNKNEFRANIYYKNKLHQDYLRYMGNKNFMRKSVSKRMLGYLYEFLKNLDF